MCRKQLIRGFCVFLLCCLFNPLRSSVGWNAMSCSNRDSFINIMRQSVNPGSMQLQFSAHKQHTPHMSKQQIRFELPLAPYMQVCLFASSLGHQLPIPTVDRHVAPCHVAYAKSIDGKRVWEYPKIFVKSRILVPPSVSKNIRIENRSEYIYMLSKIQR